MTKYTGHYEGRLHHACEVPTDDAHNFVELGLGSAKLLSIEWDK